MHRLLLLVLPAPTILGACSPSAPPPVRHAIERAAVESVAEEHAVGPFRFHLPPGFRAVADARIEDVRTALDGLTVDVPDALGVFAPTKRADETIRLFDSEKQRYRLLFRVGSAAEKPDFSDLQIEHKVWYQIGLEEGRFLHSERVAADVELGGHRSVHTTIKNVRKSGGVRVWDLVVRGRRYTMAIVFQENEDDRGGRIEGFLYSIRLETGPGA